MSEGWLTADEARKALQLSYRDKISQIIEMLPQGGYLVRGAGERARESAKSLKDAVRSYYKRPARLRQEMSQIETRFFDPCMHRVFVALQKLNLSSNPGPPWVRALNDADSELSHWLYQLEQIKAPNENPEA